MIRIKTVGFRKLRGQNLVKVSQIRLNIIDGPVTTGLGEIHIRILIIGIEEYGDILVLGKLENNWMVGLREQSSTNSHHMSISCHTLIWNITVGFKECHERLILVNDGNNQMVGFSERHGQYLVKVAETQLNLIDSPMTTVLGEIHIPILIIRIEE